MLKPAGNIFIKAFFEKYVSFIIKRNFNEISYNKIDIDPNKSVLLLANHYSWWDGFIVMYLNKVLFKKKAYVMIIEATARKFPFLRYLGAYTVNRGTKDVIASLDYTAELLADPANLVLLFPQGKIYSNFVDYVTFSGGLSRIIKKAKGQFQTLFAVSFTETLHHKKASVNVNIKNAEMHNNIADIEQDFNVFYQLSKDNQSKIIL